MTGRLLGAAYRMDEHKRTLGPPEGSRHDACPNSEVKLRQLTEDPPLPWPCINNLQQTLQLWGKRSLAREGALMKRRPRTQQNDLSVTMGSKLC